MQRGSIRDGMEVIEGYPVHTGPRPRPTKHYVGKDGLHRKYTHGSSPAEADGADEKIPAADGAPDMKAPADGGETEATEKTKGGRR